MKYLLDANVLVAIADTQHVHHDVATSWIEPAKRGTTFDRGLSLLRSDQTLLVASTRVR